MTGESASGPVEGPLEHLGSIRSWHTPGLTWRQKQVVAAVELGYTTEETAVLLNREPPTIQRHLGAAEHKIFDPHGVTPHRALLAKSCREHDSCCMTPTPKMIENNQLFTG